MLVPHGRKLSIKGLGVQGEGRVNFGLKNMDHEFPRFVITLLAAPLWLIVWFVQGLTQQDTGVEGSLGWVHRWSLTPLCKQVTGLAPASRACGRGTEAELLPGGSSCPTVCFWLKGQVPRYCLRLKQNKGKTGLVLTPLRFMAFWAVLAPKSTQSERWRPSRAQS